MFKLAILALLVTLISASTQADWLVYKRTHNKVYTGDEDVIRHYIWKSNLQTIQAHNELFAQGLFSYYKGENQFTDMSDKEFTEKMNGLKINNEVNSNTFKAGLSKGNLTDAVDWRTKGYVTPVKNQGNCFSSYAFAATGVLEGQHFKATGELVSLSESNLVDCSENFGCNGGYMYPTYKYIINNKGIDTEASYPYKPEVRNCTFKRDDVGATAVDYSGIQSGSEEALQRAVAEIGPITVCVDASHPSFRDYRGGVYDEPACSSVNVNQGMLAVGYGTEGCKEYWIVKNSWGTAWGIEGYIHLSRNKQNQCAVATYASYLIV